MKFVIFDMDGILFDSERAVFNGWKEIADKYGFENLEVPYMKCIGVNARRAKEIFLEYYGEDFPYDKYCAEQSRNYNDKYDGGKLPLMSGVFELLEYLKSCGYGLAVASSTRTVVVENQIRDAKLNRYFDVIVGGDMVKHSKPEPDIFLEAAERLRGVKGCGLSNDSIYVVEDSYNGIRAAYAAGMKPIMVPDMIAPDDEMKEKAEYIVDSLLDVISLI